MILVWQASEVESQICVKKRANEPALPLRDKGGLDVFVVAITPCSPVGGGINQSIRDVRGVKYVPDP